MILSLNGRLQISFMLMTTMDYYYHENIVGYWRSEFLIKASNPLSFKVTLQSNKQMLVDFFHVSWREAQGVTPWGPWQWPPVQKWRSLPGIIIRIILALGPYLLPQTLLKWETQLPATRRPEADSRLSHYSKRCCLSLGSSLITQLIKCQLVLTWVYLRIYSFLIILQSTIWYHLGGLDLLMVLRFIFGDWWVCLFFRVILWPQQMQCTQQIRDGRGVGRGLIFINPFVRHFIIQYFTSFS